IGNGAQYSKKPTNMLALMLAIPTIWPNESALNRTFRSPSATRRGTSHVLLADRNGRLARLKTVGQAQFSGFSATKMSLNRLPPNNAASV
ncbi:MAG TPA: hypothetical protein PKN13_15120, partial [Accumulibacter sp.]|nr:hypothetical protein [Accumulibacter sp.]HMW18516.1 hypothetical protein [Accumulibacter sp.]HNC18848.1 hypothetical protein [Accumulibacter sp.]HND81662.1 hypothetical protein [Accumulibacter sp.]HNE13895.1 hypothetical protein [Accumulibacter sp.]